MFDPATLGDSQALQTQWTPLRRGGANFTTHALHEHPRGLEYRKNGKLLAFGAVFLAFGVLALALVPVLAVVVGVEEVLPYLFAGLFGLVFTGAGAAFMWPTSTLFDRASASVTVKGRAVPFSSIVALQLLTERVDGDEGADYDSHELNLVLADGSRLNVVDHAGKEVLRDDLARLRALVGCKAWDATTTR